MYGRLILGHARLLASWLVFLLIAGCGPAMVGRRDLNRNPVEIIDESPRVYRIKFEHFADSLQTVLVANYLQGSIPRSLLVSLYAPETGPAPAESALVEYGKAVRRLDAGAIRAALMHARRAVEMDPSFMPSYVLLARLLIADGQVIAAKALLEQIVERDPGNSEALIELAACHMYLGQLEEARSALIDAVIYQRNSLDAWGKLRRLGMIEQFEVADRDAPELAYVEKVRGRNFDMVVDSSLVECPMVASAWVVYASQRAVWRYEGKYQQRFGESRYRRTYDEDVDCYMSLAVAWKVLSEGSDSAFCESEYLDFLADVADDGYLIPHVLLDYVCLANPSVARAFPPEVIEHLREYVDRYVIVPGS